MSPRYRTGQQGSLLLFSLWILTFFALVIQVTITRTLTDIRAAELSRSLHQAAELAEAGLDRKLSELPANAANIPPTARQVGPGVQGTYQVTVAAAGPSRWQVTSESCVPNPTSAATCPGGSARRTLQTIVRTNPGPIPVPAAITVVDDTTRPASDYTDYTNTAIGLDYRFLEDASPFTTVGVDGRNYSTGQSLPGLVITSAPAYQEFVDRAALFGKPFGFRLMGDGSGYTSPPVPKGTTSTYSVFKDTSTGLTRAMLNDLATWAKGQAVTDGCYIDNTTDITMGGTKQNDRPNDSCTSDPDPTTCCVYDSTGCAVTVTGVNLGTAAAPKICYAEAVFKTNGANQTTIMNKHHDVSFLGSNTGYGVLVIRGELDAGDAVPYNFTYKGLIIVIGPSGEVDFGKKSNVDIKGSIIMGTTEEYCPAGATCPPTTMKWRRTLLELYNGGAQGSVQYDSAAAQMANNLLRSRGWAPPGAPAMPAGAMLLDAWWWD